MPEPIELPARVLDAAKKSPTFFLLLEAFDPETSSAGPIEITFDAARAMIRDVISIPQAAFFPRDMMYADSKDFPLLGSGGWKFELFFRGRWDPRLTVAAYLLGPGYHEPDDEDHREEKFRDRPAPVVLTYRQVIARDYSRGT
jgi:hypothetical protein